MATDDLLHGGEAELGKDEVADNCKFGKFTSGDGRFVGKEIKCRADGSFVASQPLFAQKIELVPLDKEGKKER